MRARVSFATKLSSSSPSRSSLVQNGARAQLQLVTRCGTEWPSVIAYSNSTEWPSVIAYMWSFVLTLSFVALLLKVLNAWKYRKDACTPIERTFLWVIILIVNQFPARILWKWVCKESKRSCLMRRQGDCWYKKKKVRWGGDCIHIFCDYYHPIHVLEDSKVHLNKK